MDSRGCDMSAAFQHTAAAQRKRILEFLRVRPLDTLTARKVLDVMHPAARVMELRKRGWEIQTVKIDRASDCGEIHRVACYVLEAGAGESAPADESAGANEQGTDEVKNSMGDSV